MTLHMYPVLAQRWLAGHFWAPTEGTEGATIRRVTDHLHVASAANTVVVEVQRGGCQLASMQAAAAARSRFLLRSMPVPAYHSKCICSVFGDGVVCLTSI